ncbi:hypothetical protein D3C72_1518880 [compost metagenome]
MFQRGQPRKACLCRLGGGVGRCVVRAQGVVYLTVLRRPTTHQGQVAFVDLVVFKLRAGAAGGFGVQGQQQHAAGAFVQPVQRVDMLADLVAQGLHDEARLARVQPRAVHQPARWLVDGNQVLVLPQHGQRAALGMPVRNSGVDG